MSDMEVSVATNPTSFGIIQYDHAMPFVKELRLLLVLKVVLLNSLCCVHPFLSQAGPPEEVCLPMKVSRHSLSAIR